jgi:hypothetical protein
MNQHHLFFEALWGAFTLALLVGLFSPFINASKCPVRKRQQGKFRLPRSLGQFLWGGYTCKGCGQSFDRHNSPLSH